MNPHGTSACSLPISIPNLKCSCSCQFEAIRVCLGCYKHYCLACYKEHRRQISAELGYKIHDSNIVLQAIGPTLAKDKKNQVFNPVKVRKQIDDCYDKLVANVKHTHRRALQSLKQLMDERSDHLIDQLRPITVPNLATWRDFKNYIEVHLPYYKDEIQKENNIVEERSTRDVLVRMDHADDIDWRYLIELKQIEHTGSKKDKPIAVNSQPCFENLSKDCKPFKKIENQNRGNPIAASDHLVLYTRNGNELCIVESHADYSTVVQLSHDIDPAVKEIDIVDLCWSSTEGVFIILTSTQLFTLNPYRKIPTVIPDIRPADGHLFGSCTCSGDKILLSYSNATHSSLEQWLISDWKRKRCWNPPASTDKNKKILCIRFSSTGSLIGVSLSFNARENRFEVRNPDTMECLSSTQIRAIDTVGILSFNDTLWLIGNFNHHILSLWDTRENNLSKFEIAGSGKSTLRGMTCVNQGTVVVIRTETTVIFYDLFY